MHAGNVFAALAAWLVAKSQGGKVVLRIEDLDAERSKPAYIDAAQRDFEALGLTWDEGPYFQHSRTEAYRAAFDELAARGLVYPCFCTRADLHAASAPHRGEKPVYPGTCRGLSAAERASRALERTPAQRLRVPHEEVAFTDQVQGPYVQNLAQNCGDFLVRRSDGAFAYQLAVVVDDAEQGVSSVVRGVDLLCSTPQQIHLQSLLGLPHPDYAHVPLLVAERDRRLSKRDRDAALDALLARFPGLCFEIYHDDRRIHVLHPNDYTRNHEHLTRAKTEEVKDFREVDLPIIKLLFEEEKPLLDEVRSFILAQEWGARYELIFSSDHLLELTRRGATKGGMILKLAKLLGVARKDIYCIGDHNNDIPMLEVSEIGFAPENAIPEVKEWGAHIVCHCKDGALADVVEILNHRY